MKAIILISSIFYILGLKFSNKIDIVKKVNPVEKIITNTISATKSVKAIHFNDDQENIAKPDTLNSAEKKPVETEKDEEKL